MVGLWKKKVNRARNRKIGVRLCHLMVAALLGVVVSKKAGEEVHAYWQDTDMFQCTIHFSRLPDVCVVNRVQQSSVANLGNIERTAFVTAMIFK
jgi:hypothetical protein